jgi:hypothetical protein
MVGRQRRRPVAAGGGGGLILGDRQAQGHAGKPRYVAFVQESMKDFKTSLQEDLKKQDGSRSTDSVNFERILDSK